MKRLWRRLVNLSYVVVLFWMVSVLLRSPSHSSDSSEARYEEVPLERNTSESDVVKPGTDGLFREDAISKEDDAEWEFVAPPNIFHRNDLGEFGEPVRMPSEIPQDIQIIVDRGWKDHAFNQYLSDLISVNRSIRDLRNDYCKEFQTKPKRTLPATSVIIIFHNEAWSTLLRSVHSVLNRSPDHLLTEVILVDDFSDMVHLKKPLEKYFANFPKVKIVRAAERGGLIKARILGTMSAKGPTLTFLDSHVECLDGWLEPLLDRIAENPTIVPCPVILVIDTKTFATRAVTNAATINVGGFSWRLSFNWAPQPKSEKLRRKNPFEPLNSPTMAGGLFSIDKAFFEKLGMYDPDFDIWGAENLELSFKTWMCGGTLEIIPCSQVGHVFRSKSPYKWRTGVNVLRKNSIRLAEVWMDEYAKFFYDRTGTNKGDFGDISARVQLRKDLGCKSFKWYLENVLPDMFIPGETVSRGEIRNHGFSNKFCLDCVSISREPKAASLYPCHGNGANQFWTYTKVNEIRRDESCLDILREQVYLRPCRGSGDQTWTYINSTLQLRHHSGPCLSASVNPMKLTVEVCIADRIEQKWTLENYNVTSNFVDQSFTNVTETVSFLDLKKIETTTSANITLG